MFTNKSKAIIYGLQIQAGQHMLDFDFLCGREPSLHCFINPGKPKSNVKLFFGGKEILFPVYPNFEEIKQDSNLDTFINFASFRSAFESTVEAMKSNLFKNIVIIAEGIPERQTREIIELNKTYKLNIIGPATVGAMQAGVFRVGNTGGSLENIVLSKLYRTGNVGFVSKSGGMSNELRRVISKNTSGINLSIALGGDKYNIMTFKDAVEILQKDETTKMIVLLGEVGGKDELEIAKMIQEKQITKPVVAFCIGTIGELIKKEVQFGHAGAKSNKLEETASYKNQALKSSQAIVPESYMDFGEKIKETFQKLNIPNNLDENLEIEIQKKLEIIKTRKPTNFTSTIVDERKEELHYNKKPISQYVENGSFANVIGNLWLKRDLPKYALDFINTTLIILADHGPAVSGATNSIITARAGNDLKSSLIAGLTTIGPKFGGAIDFAAKNFFHNVQNNISPQEYVDNMKKLGENIPGIGHKVKSKFNPDKRCEILLELSKNIPQNKYLNFALKVEEITLEKKQNLILNVDGMIACCFLDIFESISMSSEEIKEYIDLGIFNAFFILARTTGFIGHILDQKRLKEGLFRTPWSDILYEE